MFLNSFEDVESHLKTHSARAEDDRVAVNVLNAFLRGGRVVPSINFGDKFPNIDGHLEVVIDPLVSRSPFQKFVVQVKSTQELRVTQDGKKKYDLSSLSFPAYAMTTTQDPCLLFIVEGTSNRGKERVYWKYISRTFLANIDFKNVKTTVVDLDVEDEIINTDESVASFADRLVEIAAHHRFINRLSGYEYSREHAMKALCESDEQIKDCLDRFDITSVSRDKLSTWILNHLNKMCDATLLLNALGESISKIKIKDAYEIALLNIKTKFLGNFLYSLNYIDNRVPDGQYERLMLKYYNYLWSIRDLLHREHDLCVLKNLEKFPRDIDEDDDEYQSIVCSAVDKVGDEKNGYTEQRYYVHYKRPFFQNGKRYFEISLQLVHAKASKFNRVTVYSKHDIPTDYAIKIGYSNESITLWGTPIEILIMTDWKVSIAANALNLVCEILKLPNVIISPSHGEYTALMQYLTNTGMNILSLIDLKDDMFNMVMARIFKDVKRRYHLEGVLTVLRNRFSIYKNREYGSNTIRYLLLKLREELIKEFMPNGIEPRVLSRAQLVLNSKCNPFETFPLVCSLPFHNPKTRDIIRSLTINVVRPEFCGYAIRRKTEETGEIYHTIGGDDIDAYNEYLESKWQDFAKTDRICTVDNKLYIKSYETSTVDILSKLSDYADKTNDGQSQVNKRYLREKVPEMISQEKRKIIEKAFVDSRVMFIYGAAGTGKTTLLNCLSDLMAKENKLFLAKTHTAVANLRSRIDVADNANAINVDHFLKLKKVDADVIFIDECSTIGNLEMVKILGRIADSAFIVLAGDIHQIESIRFGNWFHYAKLLMEPKTVNELSLTHRTNEKTIKDLWKQVRDNGTLLDEMLAVDGEGPFSCDIKCGELFVRSSEDEIVLCHDYDGHYGLNNMNRYFQSKNKNKPTYWQEWVYKEGDPILFQQSDRFTKIKNNTKGVILGIRHGDTKITFKVKVFTDRPLTAKDAQYSDEFSFISNTSEYSIIEFTVYQYEHGKTNEEKENSVKRTIVPFQVAYAVSIHKAQGLEYESVKIIIPKGSREKISHNVFYTAVTRTKKHLKIFWSSDTQRKVISEFKVICKSSESIEYLRKKIML